MEEDARRGASVYATSKSDLAITWKDQRHSGDTLVLMRNYRVLAQRVLGTDHPNTTSSVALLAQWEDTSDSLWKGINSSSYQ